MACGKCSQMLILLQPGSAAVCDICRIRSCQGALGGLSLLCTNTNMWRKRSPHIPASWGSMKEKIIAWCMMGKGSRVVVCGLAAVGKTAILEQVLYGNHIIGQENIETLEDIYIASVETERGVREQLRLYDTQGLQEGTELPKHYFSVADGFILVYSVDSLESFRKVEQLKRDIDRFRDKKENGYGAGSGAVPPAGIHVTSASDGVFWYNLFWMYHQTIIFL
ncbi:NF-kappa-B inhibitor-interacting Ras-like protein 1 isoform X2 [Dendropsophus ebraccatus]|uniref:NF-kappa-B inhibitor-interacting Ras-like protein 1 isoform X2 n=1 Tax=Dendropsophus ebraccatus TaxID=150705 RepID=UPI0038317F55